MLSAALAAGSIAAKIDSSRAAPARPALSPGTDRRAGCNSLIHMDIRGERYAPWVLSPDYGNSFGCFLARTRNPAAEVGKRKTHARTHPVRNRSHQELGALHSSIQHGGADYC